MNNIYQHYIIDLSSNNNFVQIPTVQGDGNNIRGFEVELIQNGMQYEIDRDDTLISIMGTKPDTNQIMNPCEITEDGYILIDITSQMSAVVGRGDYQIVLMSKNTNSQLKSFPFYILTTPAAFDAGDIISSNEFQTLTQNIARTERVIDSANIAISDIRQLEAYVSAEESKRADAETLRDSAEKSREVAEAIRISDENERREKESERENSEASRIAAEEERILSENTRIETETVRIKSETAREENELTRESNETERINAELDRISAESLRDNAENIRENAENDRISAETIRDKNEILRKQNEEHRTNSEIDRNDAENTRISEENIRIENENERIKNEEKRESNESDRISSENVRNDAESNRVTAETTRIENETNRIESENVRKTAETTRISEETKRIDAESTRASNETTRLNNESARQKNESDRQTNTDTAIANAEKATERANTAAETCENIVAGTGFISSAEKGVANGIATLDGNKKLTGSQLPIATVSVLGGVKIGSNITVSNGTISTSKANITKALGFTPIKQTDTTTELLSSTEPTSGSQNVGDFWLQEY